MKDSQTETYITLKPIAERFSKVANAITDTEIKGLILGAMRDQVKTIDFSTWIKQIVEDFIENNEDYITSLYKKQLEETFRK